MENIAFLIDLIYNKQDIARYVFRSVVLALLLSEKKRFRVIVLKNISTVFIQVLILYNSTDKCT